MRKTKDDMRIYESVLNLYCDKNAERFLDRKTIQAIDGFVEYCKEKDIVDNTNIAETMGIIYNPSNNMTNGELENRLALSGSSLYRFRIKLVESLNKYLSDKLSER